MMSVSFLLYTSLTSVNQEKKRGHYNYSYKKMIVNKLFLSFFSFFKMEGDMSKEVSKIFVDSFLKLGTPFFI